MDFEISDGVLLNCLGDNEEVVIPEGVERIASGAFERKRTIKSITFPISLKFIDEYAFDCYSDIKSIYIKDLYSWLSINANQYGTSPFGRCTDLFINGEKKETIIIPGEIKTIRKEAFYKCASIKNVIIQEGIVSIGEDAFRECKNLISVSLPNTIRKIDSGAFYECDELHIINIDSVESWLSADKGEYGGNPLQNKRAALYKENKTIQIRSIPNGVSSIGSFTFQDCSYLEDVVIPSSVKKIGKGAFSGCSSLKRAILPSKIDKIAESTFSHCSALLEIAIPQTVKQISKEAFFKCSDLNQVILPTSLEKIGESAFRECGFVGEISIPNKTSVIGRDAFRDCKYITKIVLPDSVEKMGEGAFWGCELLHEIVLPKSLSSVSKNLFRECTQLYSIIIPEEIATVEDHAFSDCKMLNTILMYPYRIRFGKDVFSGCEAIHKLYLPERMIGFNKYTFNEPDYVYIINLQYASIPQQLQPAALKGIAYAKTHDEIIDDNVYASYRKTINRHKDDWIYEGKIDENEIFIRFLIHEEMLDADETEHLIKRVTKYNLPELINMLMQYQTNHFEPDDYTGLLEDEL